MDGTVLVADDDRTIRTVLTQALTRAGCRVHATSSLTTLMRWVGEGRGDLVISDVMMPDGNGLEMLPKLHDDRPNLPVIIISAQNTIMTAIKATEMEAYDYLPKPFDLPDLLKRAGQALALRRLPQKSKGDDKISAVEEALPLVGRSAIMQELYRQVARVVHADIAVLISGESGTGKSMIAKILHDFSDQHNRGFAILTHDLLHDPSGLETLRARVRGGTLVIDGLDELSDDEQARLLTFVSHRDEDAPRIISILKRLDETEAAARLRQDLYFRLSGVVLSCPNLRQRVEDISHLIEYFLDHSRSDGDHGFSIDRDGMELMKSYTWPGNVRQLENFVKRLVLFANNKHLSAAAIERELQTQPDAQSALPQRGTARLALDVEKHVRRYFELHGKMLPPAGVYARILREFEAPLLTVALEATSGNQAKCADLLGMNRNTLRKKIRELDLEVTRRRKLS